MGRRGELKTVSRFLLFCLLVALFLTAVSICTPFWFTTYPLLQYNDVTLHSIGLLGHCSDSKRTFHQRRGILQFKDYYWPYQPLRSKDFDTILLLLLISIGTSALACLINLALCVGEFNHCLKWLLLLMSTISAISGLTGVVYVELRVKSDKLQHWWTSYVAWLAVVLLTFTIIPVFNLIFRQKHEPPVKKCECGMNDSIECECLHYQPFYKPQYKRRDHVGQ